MIAIFTGIGQGAQPLLSRYYGLGETKVLRKFVKLSFITYLVAGFLFFLISQVFTGQIIEVFNSEGNDQLAQLKRIHAKRKSLAPFSVYELPKSNKSP